MKHPTICAIAIAIASTEPLQARPAEGLLLGEQARRSSGAYATQVRGPEATVGNPALLAVENSAVSAVDLDGLYLAYDYQRTGAGPTKVRVKTPILQLGGALPLTRHLRLAVTSLPVPKGAGELQVKDLPLQLKGAPDAASVDIVQTTIGPVDHATGLGVGARLAKRAFVGAAVNLDQDSSLTTVLDQGEELLSFEYRRRTLQFRLGAFAQLTSAWSVGAYYVSARQINAQTEFKNTGGENVTAKGKRGSQLGVGLAYDLPRFTAFADIVYDRRSEDRGSLDPLAQVGGSSPLDRRDTLGVALGGRIIAPSTYRVTTSYGYFPSGIGDGISAGETVILSGPQFGDLTALSRHTVGLGIGRKVRRWQLTQANSLTIADRKVPDSGSSEGYYKIRSFIFGIRADYRY